ncbi:hypothetical protein [Haloarcula onubensis]|uniref:Transcriptional regulator n=1 Tax=Haloarcula onubensis TaxID=2950539 RepID=A0ABU2FWX2_9EURY|nr:hypothetical protein [Halomicroarcula sp. S3CR25-11]MDS0284646.1 hypothetical protein [Halomicroarcula sp. S3CR25-11]
MEFVVEDPQRTGGITTYEPTGFSYEESTGMYSLRLADGDGEVERWIPRERIVYVEREPDGASDR